MKKSTRTLLAFDETQQKQIDDVKRALSVDQKKEMSNAELFKIALGLGFAASMRLPLKKRSNNGARLEYFKDEDWALFAAIQLVTRGEVTSILDTEDMLSTAEEYAAAGIGLMADAQRTQPDLRLWLQVQVQSALAESQE